MATGGGGGGGGMNLGGAQFVITANTTQFQQGLQQAQAQAGQTGQAIATALQGAQAQAVQTGQVIASALSSSLQAVPPQLAAVGQGFQVVGQQAQAAGAMTKSQVTGMAMGAMQLGQAIDDIQYGFGAIVNNIPMLGMSVAQAMGAGASEAMLFAGAVGIVAVGVYQLYQHWGDLSDALQSTWSGQPIEQLRKVREEAEETAKAFEKLAKTPSKAQAAQAKGVTQAITEGPTGEVMKGLAEAIAQDPGLRAEMSPEDEEELRRLRDPRIFEQTERIREKQKKIVDSVMEANVKKAQELMVEAGKAGPEGDNARATIERLTKQAPGAFPEGFARRIEQASPEAMRHQKIMEEYEKQGALEAGIGMQDLKEKKEKKKEDERSEAAARHAQDIANQMDAEEEEKRQRLRTMRETWAQEDRIESLRKQDRMRHEAATRVKEAAKFMGTDFFEYATSIGKSAMEQRAEDLQKSMDKRLKDAVDELKKLNRRHQEARAG